MTLRGLNQILMKVLRAAIYRFFLNRYHKLGELIDYFSAYPIFIKRKGARREAQRNAEGDKYFLASDSILYRCLILFKIYLT